MAPTGYRVAVGVILAVSSFCGLAADQSEICRQLRNETRKAERSHKLPAFATPDDAVGLCFSQYHECDKGDLHAERFWEATKNPEDAKAIKGELTYYSDLRGEVTRTRVNGRRTPIVHIARHVGTAQCIRDTYLEQLADGYRLLDNASLQDLSQEAGYCLGSYVSYLYWRGRTYAILVDIAEDWRELSAMTASVDLQLTKVCSTKWDTK